MIERFASYFVSNGEYTFSLNKLRWGGIMLVATDEGEVSPEHMTVDAVYWAAFQTVVSTEPGSREAFETMMMDTFCWLHPETQEMMVLTDGPHGTNLDAIIHEYMKVGTTAHQTMEFLLL